MHYSPDFSSRFRILKGGKISLVVSALIASVTMLHAAPSGGVVTSGSASIAQSGSVTTITQSTNKAAINWQNFSIGKSETVNFNQPTVNAVTLNRVVGNEKSIIDGALNANGQVFILNSNGVLFSKTASINTAGFVATTMNLSDADFMNGNYAFKGDSQASIINQGTINISDKGYASLFGKEVKNEGFIKATLGKVELVGAKEVTLNLNGNSLVNLKVNKGVLDALVENKGAIYADGGEVYLTTNAVNELLKGVVNNTGIIEANSLDDITGKVELYAHGGEAKVDGTIKAKEGFVETSGDKVTINDNFRVTADKWLIDPTDFIIAASGGDMSGATISTNLSTSDIEIKSINGANGTKGDIHVNDTITWNTDKKLTLNAQNDIFINQSITAQDANGKLALYYGQASVYYGNTSDYHINAKVNLQAGDNFLTKLGSNGTVATWTVVTDATIMQAMTLNDTSKRYVLGTDLSLSGTNNWTPIGGNDSSIFQGKFDGLGHTVSNLHIDNATDYRGLFGYVFSATIRNIGVVNGTITGGNNTGGLIGRSGGSNGAFSEITNSYFSGTVSYVSSYAGGLIGASSHSNISNSYATGTVTGSAYIGGLVGLNNTSSTISNSYATNNVTYSGGFADMVGGLVGKNESGGKIINSYASGTVTSTQTQGGLIGYDLSYSSGVTSSYYDKDINTIVTNDSATYGKIKSEIITLAKANWSETFWATSGNSIEGYATDIIALPVLKTFFKPTATLFNSGFGTSATPYTITNWTQLQNINYASDTTLLNKYYTLLNNINSATADYTALASATANGNTGWNPIGSQYNSFAGNFNGDGHTISNLTIKRETEDYIGLFGGIRQATIQNVGLVSVDIRGKRYVGGLVGFNDDATIKNSYAAGSVLGSGDNVGGLVGYNAYGTITNSYATGSVSGASIVGGLVGRNFSGNISKSYSTASVSGTSSVGGLVGVSNGFVTNSFWDTSVYGTSAGGTGKTTAELKKFSTFDNAGWDVGVGASETPVLSMGGSHIWMMAPESLNYSLADKSETYKGAAYTLTDLWNATAIFGAGFSGWVFGTDYRFLDNNGDAVTSYTNAGTYSNLHIDVLRNGYTEALSGNTEGVLTIAQKALTISGITASNKTYDGLLTATVNTASVAKTGLIAGDTLTVSSTGVFANKNAGTGKTVTLTNTYGGADVNNYAITDQTTTTADIAQKALTITGISADNKTYDGLLTATVNTASVAKTGLIDGDTLTVSSTGVFADKNAGTGKTVTLTNTYAGADKDNYTITGQTTTTANIDKKALTITGLSADNKTYDGTTSVVMTNWGSLAGLVGTETLSLGHGTASFDTATEGNGKTVTAIGYTLSDGTNGGVVGNYLLAANTATTTANITAVSTPPVTPPVTPPTQDLTPIITQIINGTAITPPVIPNFTPPPPAQAPQQFNAGGARVQLVSVPSGDTPSQLVGTQEARAMVQGGEVGDLRIPLGQNSHIQLVNGGVHLPDGLEQEFFMAQR